LALKAAAERPHPQGRLPLAKLALSMI